jgi:hypothetical protein
MGSRRVAQFRVGNDFFLFDTSSYVSALGWLGVPVRFSNGSIVSRSLPLGLQDARGSWPYQSPPRPELLDQIIANKAAINLTVVIRPDVTRSEIDSIVYTAPKRLQPLKDHLCHRASSAPVSATYSTRTRKRLDLAHKDLTVEREAFSAKHMVIVDWQEEVRAFRRIPRQSSPDRAHFQHLADHAPALLAQLACVTLRWRKGGALCGMILAGQDRETGSWHAHSALSTAQARAAFGMYLLFDGFIRLLGIADIWFGGAPNGPVGGGVFRFKQRFANYMAPAHILSIDLSETGMKAMSQHFGTYPYLPNYRNPMTETQLETSQAPLVKDDWQHAQQHS